MNEKIALVGDNKKYLTSSDSGMDSSSLMNKILEYYATRGLTWPTPQEAFLWVMSEVGEVADELMIATDDEGKWVRNDKSKEGAERRRRAKERFVEEVGDVIFMCLVTCMSLGSWESDSDVGRSYLVYDPIRAMCEKIDRKIGKGKGK